MYARVLREVPMFHSEGPTRDSRAWITTSVEHTHTHTHTHAHTHVTHAHVRTQAHTPNTHKCSPTTCAQGHSDTPRRSVNRGDNCSEVPLKVVSALYAPHVTPERV